MAKVRKIDWSFDEWIAGTQGMTPEQEGLYCRLINRLYTAGGELPIDDKFLASLCNLRPQMWRRIWPSIRAKFDETDGKLRQNRVITELFLAQTRMKLAQNAAFARLEKRKNNAIADARDAAREMPSSPPSPSLKKESPPVPPKGDFEVWWNLQPNKVGKRAAERSYRLALVRASPEQLVIGMQRYIASKPLDRPWCNPTTWLNQDRWLDEPATLPLGNGQTGPIQETDEEIAAARLRLHASLAARDVPDD